MGPPSSKSLVIWGWGAPKSGGPHFTTTPEPEAPNHTPVEHAYSTARAFASLVTAGQAGRRVVSGLGKVDNRICIVLEWTPEEASLLQDRPSLAACCSVKGTWETQNHQKFCMRLVLVSFTINLQLHVHYN